MSAMKWWGWGDEDVAFTHEDKPELGPFLERVLEARRRARRDAAGRVRRARRRRADAARPSCAPRSRPPPAPTTSRPTRSTASSTRAARACATSCAIARGDARPRCPTSSCAPATRTEVAGVVRAALDADAVVIPFGGGTNISGSLEAPADEDAHGHLGRPRRAWTACSTIDDASRLARVQAGVVRPAPRGAAQRARLDASATSPTASPTRRSAAGSRRARRACSPTSTATSPTSRARVRVVTPAGRSSRARCRRTSTGPSVREMVLGSEGRLGIITEATIHVHRAAGASA